MPIVLKRVWQNDAWKVLYTGSPIVLIRVHLVQIYTTDGAMCHAMSCKHSSLTGIPARVVIFCINKNMNFYKITCIPYST